MILERLDLAKVDWARLDAYPDRMVFQTREWLRFIERTQGAELLIGELRENGAIRGYFTALVSRRFGLSILGSPMPGWTTTFLGFNLEPGVPRRAAVEALLESAFGRFGCAHIELRDRFLTLDQVDGLGFEHDPWRGREIDLRPSEDELFGAMKSSCRRAIRKAAKEGVIVEEAAPEGFAEEYYAQSEDVFAKQALVPPFGAERISDLIEVVHPSGNLLLLRAKAPDGASIATGIFPALNTHMHFLAGASWRSHQGLRPNEALIWHAMRHWKQRGIEACDLGGYMSYKLKYGGEDVHLQFLRKSRSRALGGMRNLARAAVDARQSLHGRLRSVSDRSSGPDA